MSDTFRLGRIAGVRIGVNWTLLVMAALLAVLLADNQFPLDAPGYSRAAYWLAGLIGAVMLFVGVLLHELGHAFVARRAGLAVDGVTLWFMGGLTRIEGESPSPGAELRISGAGPLVSVLVGLACAGGRWLAEQAGAQGLTLSVLGWLALINVTLAIFNLLPAAPLDGGRILRSAVWAITKDRFKATQVAAVAGMGLGVILVAFGAWSSVERRGTDGLVLIVLGWFMYSSARSETQIARVHHALEGVTVADVMRPVRPAPGWVTVQSFLENLGGDRTSVFMLEAWGAAGRTTGLVATDGLVALGPVARDRRVSEVAVPVADAREAAPTDDVIGALSRGNRPQVLLAVDGGFTVGAVLPTDVEALIRSGRPPAWSRRGGTLQHDVS